MRNVLLTALGITLMLAGPSHALTGAELAKSPTDEGIRYVEGVLDAIFTFDMGAKAGLAQHLEQCLVEADIGPEAVYWAVLKSHDSGDQSAPATLAVIEALTAVCGALPAKSEPN